MNDWINSIKLICRKLARSFVTLLFFLDWFNSGIQFLHRYSSNCNYSTVFVSRVTLGRKTAQKMWASCLLSTLHAKAEQLKILAISEMKHCLRTMYCCPLLCTKSSVAVKKLNIFVMDDETPMAKVTNILHKFGNTCFNNFL